MTWDGGGGFPPAVRRAILRRDGNRCTQTLDDHTRCSATTRLEADHVVPIDEARRLGWTDDEIHDPANGVTLCHDHHWHKTRAAAAAGRRRANASRPRRRPTKQHPGLTR